jgi:hypothetical protein
LFKLKGGFSIFQVPPGRKRFAILSRALFEPRLPVGQEGGGKGDLFPEGKRAAPFIARTIVAFLAFPDRSLDAVKGSHRIGLKPLLPPGSFWYRDKPV